MPGLLDTKGCNFYTIKFAIAVVAEMLGVFVFAFYSSKTPAEYAAWANGLSLAVVGARQPLWPRAHAFLSMVCMPSCTPGAGWRTGIIWLSLAHQQEKHLHTGTCLALSMALYASLRACIYHSNAYPELVSQCLQCTSLLTYKVHSYLFVPCACCFTMLMTDSSLFLQPEISLPQIDACLLCMDCICKGTALEPDSSGLQIHLFDR